VLLSVLFAVLLLLAFNVASAGATKTHLFQEDFGSAAQPVFEGADGLAVEQATGDLLVIDSSALTVSRYHPDGTPDPFPALGTNAIDAKGSGKCATVPADCDQTPQNGFLFDAAGPGEQQVAVDSSGTATDGNIYVTQGNQAAGNLVDVFAASGKYLGQLTAAGTTKFGSIGVPFSPCGVAVDGSGNVYLAGGYDNKIYKFDPAANPPVNADNVATFPTSEPICNLAIGTGPSAGSLFVNTFHSKENSVLKLNSVSGTVESLIDPTGRNLLVAVDPASGHLYVFGGKPDPATSTGIVDFALREYDASGASPSLLSSTPKSPVMGLAINGTSIYVAIPGSGAKLPVKVYGPLVTVPDVTTGGAEITGDTSARLNGTVDPDGVLLEECFFEYGLTTTYGQTVPCAESVGEIGTAPKKVHADISGLTPETLYHYRLGAKNPSATIRGTDKSFRTPGKPSIPGLWSQEVGLHEALLKAQVNPENSPTTYRFEWGTDASYGNSTAEVAIGSGEVAKTVSLALDGLQAATSYHYRLVATNGIDVTEAPDHTFTTYPAASAAKADCPNQAFRGGAAARLPDCRAFEMVSPVDKNGGDIKVLVNIGNFPARYEQSATDGNRFAYSSVTAFAGAQSAPWTSEYLATRTPGGWSTEPLNPPRESTSLMGSNPVKFDVQYHAFSSDLSSGWLFQDANPPLDSCAPEGFINLYRRDNVTGTYEALIPNAPTNVASNPDYRLELQGVSEDGSRRVFSANAKLTSDASNSSIYQLYEHIRGEGCGQLRLVSFKPSGVASTEESSAGAPLGPGEYRASTVARAVSADGSRVFFNLGGGPISTESLYLRVNSDQEQSVVSAGKCTEPDKGCTLQIATKTARFWTAATDGSVGIYSVDNNLFEYDVEKALAGEAARTLITADLLPGSGVAGASEDASRIYFVSEEAIGGEGEAGKPNLYLYQPSESGSGRYRLIATLDLRDLKIFPHSGFSLASFRPIENGVRVTPDGAHLAFVSIASLTGYDNADAIDGRPDLEVFLYDAGADRLACVSCNPSGARPIGRDVGVNNDFFRIVAAQMPPGESQTFAPRVLSEDGNSLFFESFEALLPRDVNGKADVYQWQRASSQSECDASGAELYVPASGGCLSLISTGQSPSDSEIADASPDGSNVFIRTAESLLPQDPGQVDVYDARVNGGFSQPPGQPAACEGEACQGPLASPEDPTPASSAFHGPGNVKPAKPPRPCPKGKVRRKGRCVPKKHAQNHKHRKHHRQADDKRRAGR
jgi:hypothetical protein